MDLFARDAGEVKPGAQDEGCGIAKGVVDKVRQLLGLFLKAAASRCVSGFTLCG